MILFCFTQCHGASDAIFFLERNISILVIASMDGDHHEKNERKDIEDLEKFYEALKEFVRRE